MGYPSAARRLSLKLLVITTGCCQETDRLAVSGRLRKGTHTSHTLKVPARKVELSDFNFSRVNS